MHLCFLNAAWPCSSVSKRTNASPVAFPKLFLTMRIPSSLLNTGASSSKNSIYTREKNRKKKCKIYQYIVITHTSKWDYMYQMSIIHSWTLTTSLSFELNGSPLILMITSALFDTKLAAIWVTSTGPICINKSVNRDKQNKEIGKI